MSHPLYSSPEEDVEAAAFGRATEKLRSSIEPRKEAFAQLLEVLPEVAVTKSDAPRLFKQETRKSINWFSMLQNHWPRYAFALVAILAVVGITFGLSNRKSDTTPNPVADTTPTVSPTKIAETSGTGSDAPVSANTPIDTAIAEATVFSEDDFTEEDDFETGNDAEEDALLISLYESYDENTL